MQHNEIAAQAQTQQINVLKALGFSSEQITRALQSGVTSEQLRGMLRYRQCVDPLLAEAGLFAQIDRIAELEKLLLDSLTT
jgi:hypothetical protein